MYICWSSEGFGHRLGTMEIESALVANPRVAEAAIVGKPDEIKGESVFAFVVLRGPRPTGDTSALVKELRNWVGEQLGPIAKPDNIRFADNLPKTRSGKIMRRLLRAIASDQAITQDISTLENPAIVDQLRGIKAPVKAARAPRKPARRKRKAAQQLPLRKKKVAKKAAKKRPPVRRAKPKPRAKPKSRKVALAKRSGRKAPARGRRKRR
jgi:hypothetical protein